MEESKSFSEISSLVMDQAAAKGFGTTAEEINVPEKIALIHSEVSEAYQAWRHKNIDGKDGFKEELGDVIQRVLHLAGSLNIDLEAEIIKKIEANKDRVWDWEKLNENKKDIP